VNRCQTPRNREAVFQPGGMWAGVQCTDGWTPKPFSSVGGEAMVKACGVAMTMLPG